MKVKLFGAQGKYQSGPLIKQEMESRSYKFVDLPSEEPDLLIHLTGLFDEAEEFYNNCDKKPIRIYSLLDIDHDKPDFAEFYKNIKDQLENAEIGCVISEFVKKDVENSFGIKNLKVWHYPIRPVTFNNSLKTIVFSYTGRLYSKNKRFNLVGETLDCLNFDRNKFVTAGPERPPFGMWATDLTDEEMCQFRNSSIYLIAPSVWEGQGCGAIEAAIARCFPILTPDCEVNKEWGLDKFCSEKPTGESLAKKILEIETNKEYYYDILNELGPDFEKRFLVNGVVNKLEELIKEYQNAR